MNRVRPMWLLVLGAAAMTSLLLGQSSFAVAAESAHPLSEQSSKRLAYTLSLKFEGTYVMHAQGSSGTGEEQEHTAFLGSSKRFWLVRSGTASKPSYTVASSDGTPLMLYLSGPLTFAGTGHFVLETCSYEETMTLKGDKSAHVSVVLAKNRLRPLISSNANVSVRESAGCGTAKVYTRSLHLQAPQVPARFEGIDAKQVRFGRSFTLVRTAQPLVWPALHRPFKVAGGTGYEDWSYQYTLRFVPVQAR